MLKISDDGDEVVFFHVNGELIGTASHESFGWGGMTEVILLVKEFASKVGISVIDVQDIV